MYVNISKKKITRKHKIMAILLSQDESVPMMRSSIFLAASSIIALLLLMGIPHTIYAQESLPDELLIFKSLQDGLTQITTAAADNAVNAGSALLLLVIGYIAGKSAARITKKIVSDLLVKGKERLDKAAKSISKKSKDAETQETTQEDILEDKGFLSKTSDLIPTTIKWFVYISFIIAAVDALGFIVLSDALSSLWLWIPKIIASIIVLILGSILVHLALRWLLSQKTFQSDDPTFQAISTGLKVVIYSIVVAIAMTQLGIGEEVITTLVQAFAWALAGAFILAVGLGLRKIVPLIVIGRDNKSLGIRVGNEISIDGKKGKIIKIGITKVKLQMEGDVTKLMPHDMLQVLDITSDEDLAKDD